MKHAATAGHVSYSTVRTWLAKGREDPDGVYGAFVAATELAKAELVQECMDTGPLC